MDNRIAIGMALGLMLAPVLKQTGAEPDMPETEHFTHLAILSTLPYDSHARKIFGFRFFEVFSE